MNIKIIFILILNKLIIWGRFYNLKKITIKSIVFVCYRFFIFLKPGSKKKNLKTVLNENILRVAKNEGNVVTKNSFYLVVSKQNKLFFKKWLLLRYFFIYNLFPWKLTNYYYCLTLLMCFIHVVIYFSISSIIFFLFEEIKMIYKTKWLSSRHKVYMRRKPKITRVVQQQKSRIGHNQHIIMGFGTNYESYNEKLKHELWTTKG